MKKIISLFFLIGLCINLYSQKKLITFNSQASGKAANEAFRIIHSESINGIEIEYKFDGAFSFAKKNGSKSYQLLQIKNFSLLQHIGRPALPAHIDIIAIPENAEARVKIISFESKEYDNYLIFPALKPALDKVGAPEPQFEIDSVFYGEDINYPSNIIDIVDIQKIRGLPLASVQICPVQYNPFKKKIIVYSKIRYKIEFTKAESFIRSNDNSEHFLNNFANLMLNSKVIKDEISLKHSIVNKSSNSSDAPKNYIIVTHSNYNDAADSLAKWKMQMGYSVEIISKSNWSSSMVKSEIQTRYNNWTPKPDFVAIIGDHTEVPGQIIMNSMGDNFATDLYYTCMDGANDYYADMARGRISVTSASQAMMVVQKIINYERFPFIDSLFYKSGINAAYFQDDDANGYADRRFAQTSEDIRNYMVNSQSFDVTRVYKTNTATNPMYWNNGTYSAGEAIPAYLKKPTFPWNGNNLDINNKINSSHSALYLFHRDHGYELGWGDPSYTNTDINNLNNGNRLPVVFSINCLTGKFLEPECFSEKFLRKANGGTAGIFGHAEVSYSGYNDGLSLGLIDAIWSNPGLIPNFTGNGDNPQGSPTAHTPIYTLGDVGNQSLIRMVQTWGNNQYTFELLHYFGDPSMKIWTANPIQITATHNSSINCISDTSFIITNASCLDGLATLVVDNNIIGSVQLVNGYGMIHFASINASYATLSISKHNYKPYISDIIINGNCPKSKFIISSGTLCLMDSIFVSNQSSGSIASYFWNFGANASPATSNLAQPLPFIYSTSGNKQITLTVTDSSNHTNTFTANIQIDPVCKYLIPKNAVDSSSACYGIIKDDGGENNYSDNTNGVFIIHPNNAANVTLNFSSFNFENVSDYLYIYDGSSTSSPLIGQYTGTSLPNGGSISSTSGSITLRQTSDANLSFQGFEASWQCNAAAPPECNFILSDTSSCTGIIKFTDVSTNGPTMWHWDFGDGITSAIQHPTHNYQNNGTYNVKLYTANTYGSDSIIKTSIVNVIDKPVDPILPNDTANCGATSFTLNAGGSGNIKWFNSPTASLPINTGQVFNTPVLSFNTSYYIESQINKASIFGGKTDNTGGGGYFNNTNIHYLVFDCLIPTKIISVKVYATSAANRTFQLQDSTGAVLKSITAYVPNGTSRVTLNFDVAVQKNLRLAGPASPNLYRNNGGTAYPYLIGNKIAINYCSATTNPTSYYYYFYDWEIEGDACISNRLPLNIYINTAKPIASFTHTTNLLNIDFNNTTLQGNSYLWDFGDGTTSTLLHPSHAYNSYGNYTVKLISKNACGLDTVSKNINLSLSINELKLQSNLNIYPNPTNSLLNIEIPDMSSGKLQLQLITITGQLIWNNSFELPGTLFNTTIDMKRFAKGIYYLRFQQEQQIIVKKVIKL
jgi:PKD repeat protein